MNQFLTEKWEESGLRVGIDDCKTPVITIPLVERDKGVLTPQKTLHLESHDFNPFRDQWILYGQISLFL